MKIALINGSPKSAKSASAVLTGVVKGYLRDKCDYVDIYLNKASIKKSDIDKLKDVDVMLFAFPLYVDGIPGHLLACLTQIENADIYNKDKYIYGISNCGFYEGVQNNVALDILKNWSLKAGFVWGGGIGIGGGGCISMLRNLPTGRGPRASIDKELEGITEAILGREVLANKYVTIDMPRFAYKMAAQMGWRQAIRANGLRVKALGKRPE